jgi:hypothetical protein
MSFFCLMYCLSKLLDFKKVGTKLKGRIVELLYRKINIYIVLKKNKRLGQKSFSLSKTRPNLSTMRQVRSGF